MKQKNLLLTAAILFLNSTFLILNCTSQNIGINTAGATPDASSMLDIVSTNKGLLIPRVALTATNSAVPITSPAISLQVYNTATAGAGSMTVYPGYYYWDGTKWVAFAGTGGLDWSLLGNAGTNGGANFLGTTDNVPLRFRTNNTEKMIIDSTGNVGIGTTNPTSLFHVNGLTAATVKVDASTDPGADANAWFRSVGKGTYYSGLIMETTTNGIGGAIQGANPVGANNAYVDIMAGGFSYIDAKIKIQENGNVGIGVISPASAVSALHVLTTSASSLPWGITHDQITTGVHGSVFLGRKARGTASSLSTIVNGDVGAFLVNSFYDGSAYLNTASAGFMSNGTVASGSIPTDFVINTGAVTGTGTERMRVTSAGHVGIGSTNPIDPLHVVGTSNSGVEIPIARFQTGTALADDRILEISGRNNFYISLQTMNLASTMVGTLLLQQNGGNVAIGAYTSPTASSLSVNGTAEKTGGGTWAVLSDKRLKQNIAPFNDGLAKLLQINPVTFQYNGLAGITSKETYVGVVAQEIQKVLPYSVKEVKMLMNPKDTAPTENILQYDPNAVTYILVNAVKEQQKMIDELQMMNCELKAHNNEQKADIEKIKLQLGLEAKAEK